MKRARAELALAGITIIWGTTFVVVKSALAEVSTFVFLTLRFWVAALALLAIYRPALRKCGAAAGGAGVWAGVWAGTLLFVAYVFQTLGLERTAASQSAFLTGLSIPLVPFIASVVYKLRPRPLEVAGILIASTGMALMTTTSFCELLTGMTRGDVYSLLCAVTFAIHIVFIGHYSQRHGFESLAVVQIVTAALLGSVLFRFVGPVRFRLTPGVAAAVLATGLLATALAFTTQAWAQQYTSSDQSGSDLRSGAAGRVAHIVGIDGRKDDQSR